MEAKFRIYRGIICLETHYQRAHLWWDQGFGLDYCPYRIDSIQKLQFGHLEGTNQPFLAVNIPGTGLVAINLPRSDIFGLEERIKWPKGLRKPYSIKPNYTNWPEKI